MSTSKRKHSTISIKEKYEILIKLSQGISGKALAQEYNIGTSTISDIKKKSDKILTFVAENADKIGKVRTLRHQEFPEMETALSEWYFKQKQQNLIITESLLTSKAREIFRKFYGNERHFTASRCWLWKFRKRFHIGNLNFKREKSPCNSVRSSSSPLLLHNFLDVQINNGEEHEQEQEEQQQNSSTNEHTPKIQHNLAVMSLSIATEWALQNNANPADIQALLRLQNQAQMYTNRENT